MADTGLKLDALKPSSLREIESYKQEIEEYLYKPKQLKMPALNQEQLLTDILRTFNSSYPHNLLTGDTGIGKTVISEFILDTFKSEKNYIRNLKLVTPEQRKLFGTLKTKFEKNQNQSYIFMPNLQSPKQVKPYTYDNQNDLEKDGLATEYMTSKMIELISFFTIENKELISENVTKNKTEFKFDNEKVFDKFVKDINKIIKEETPNFLENSKILDWANKFVEFIKKDKKNIKNSILYSYEGIGLFEKAKPKQGDRDMTIEEFIELSPKILGDRKSNDLLLSEIREYFNFTIKHNELDFPVEVLLTPNIKENIKDQEIANQVILGNQGITKGLGTFYSINQEFGQMPPHATFGELGPLFKGSIIYVKDAFSEFLKSTAYLDNSSKERFLIFLETGKIVQEIEGIQYEFDLPKMILASDNRDPFERIEDSHRIVRETGLEARITEHKVPSFTTNNKEGRENTLYIITSKIDELNKEHKTDIKIDVDTLEELIKSTKITDNLLLTKFRDFRNKVEELYQHANSNEIKKITLDTLKKIKLEKTRAEFFTTVEKDCNNYNYNKIPEKSSGFVNGTAVTGSGSGSVIGIKTNFLKARGKVNTNTRIRLVDLETRNGDQATHKGFILANEYITNFLSDIEDKELLENFNWQSLTHFYRLSGELGGDSASTAIASSIVSELSQIPIYKDRFITGTLEPNGIVGQIGGVYQKATAPYRVSQIKDKEQTFIFPGSNVEDLNQELITDPYNITQSISLIPVDTFAQAFKMLTADKLESHIISNSQKLGDQVLNEAIFNIEKRLQQEYKPKIKNKNKYF